MNDLQYQAFVTKSGTVVLATTEAGASTTITGSPDLCDLWRGAYALVGSTLCLRISTQGAGATDLATLPHLHDRLRACFALVSGKIAMRVSVVAAGAIPTAHKSLNDRMFHAIGVVGGVVCMRIAPQ